MTPLVLDLANVSRILTGRTFVLLQKKPTLTAGEQVFVREGWRGWNSAGVSREDDEKLKKHATEDAKFAARIEALEALPESESRDAELLALVQLRALSGAMAMFSYGWADIDYRADGSRHRFKKLNGDQVSEARVIGEIDVDQPPYDPWRKASAMPDWAARIKFKVKSVKSTPDGWRVNFEELTVLCQAGKKAA